MDRSADLAFFLILLLLSAFFSGSETALFSLPRARRAALAGGKRARALRLLAEPQRLLATILFGNLLVNIAATSFATAICLEIFGDRGLGVAILGMGFTLLVVGEIAPKAYAYRRNEAVAGLVAGPIGFLMRALTPVVTPLRAVTNLLLRRAGVDPVPRPLGREDLETAVDLGTLDPVEKELLGRVVSFGETTVREVMTPRVRVEAVPHTLPLGELESAFKKTGLSRMPVHEERFENVVGVAYAKDLFARGGEMRTGTARDLMRAPFFVPESMKIRNLLRAMRKRRVHYAVAVDEHGSLEGVVTLEDVLEEIVGELEDERKEEVRGYARLEEDSVTVVGHLELEKLNELLGTRLASKGAETVAGLLLEHTGRIPRTGESFRFEGLKFLILDATPNRIERIFIERSPDPQEEGP